MFENIGNFFKKMMKTEQKELLVDTTSKDAAKERLHIVLMQDRANVSADFLELMKQEIIDVIKKYIVIDEEQIDVRLTNQENEDGTTGAPSLYANIPILNIRNDIKGEVLNQNSNNSVTKPDETNVDFSDRTVMIQTIDDNVENNNINENDIINDNKEEIDVSENENEEENENVEINNNIENIVEENIIETENIDNTEEKNETLTETELDEEDDDDDVTFDDLLKAAEEEEKKQAEEKKEIEKKTTSQKKSSNKKSGTKGKKKTSKSTTKKKK